MTADYYNNDISLNDTLALMLGYNLWEFRREKVDLLDHLERNLADCCHVLDEAKSAENDEAIEKCTLAAQEASQELKRAGDLYTKLCGEIAKVRQGKPSSLLIVEDDSEGTGYDLVRIARQSLHDWASQAEIKVGPGAPPPTRKHTTPLLELLDELIGEFWEEHELGRLPTQDIIKAYVRDKYGEWVASRRNNQEECIIPDLSDKVIESMITIMRPPKLRNKR